MLRIGVLYRALGYPISAFLELQELSRLIESTLALAVQAEQAGQQSTAAFHLDRALFLEQELHHAERAAAA